MVLVILWGAVVRATSSGAGCGKNWPLCNGDFVPHHPRLATVIEYTHRSMSGVCTTLVAALLAWTLWARPRGDRARTAAIWSAVLLVTEALLGALLVLGGYVEHNTSDARVLVQCIHFTNTMLLLAALSLTWWFLRPQNDLSPSTKTELLACRTPARWAILLTIITGATGSVAALADTLFPATSLRAGLAADFDPSSPLLVHMRWMHPASTILATLAILWLATRSTPTRRSWLVSLVLLQLALGLADISLLAPISLQVLHLLGADLLWIALVAIAGEALWPQRVVAIAQHAQTSGPLTAN